jgi:hypothetical protein
MRKQFIIVLMCLVLLNARYVDDKDLEELFSDFKENKMANQGQLIYFFHIREHKQKEDVNWLSSIVKNFLLSINISGGVFNWKNHDIVVIVPPTAAFEVDIVVEHFTEWIDKGGVRSSAEFSKPMEL